MMHITYAQITTWIILIIRSFSRTALFWRYVLVTDMADHIRSHPPDIETTKISLLKIHRWKRDTQVQYPSDEAELPVMRLGVDSNGTQKVEWFTTDAFLSNIFGVAAHSLSRNTRICVPCLQKSRYVHNFLFNFVKMIGWLSTTCIAEGPPWV